MTATTRSALTTACQSLFLLIGSTVVLYYGRSLLAPLAFALVLAMLLLPLCRWLEKRRVPRSLAAVLAIFLLAGVSTGIFYLLSWQLQSIMQDAGQLKDRLNELFSGLQDWLSRQLGLPKAKQQQLISKGNTELFSSIAGLVNGLLGTLVDIILVLVYIFLFLKFREHLCSALLKAIPVSQQTNVKRLIAEAGEVSQQYLAGLALMIACLWVMYGIGFSLIGVRYALFFALLCGTLELIPFFGNITGTLTTVCMGLLQGGDTGLIIGILVTYGSVQFIQSYILQPLVVGREVNLNPLFTILYVVIGDAVWGIPGMVLAVPLFSMLKITCDHFEPLKPYGFLLGSNAPRKKRSGWLSGLSGSSKKNKMTKVSNYIAPLCLTLLISACSPRGSLALFRKLSPHEQYVEKLKRAGLDRSGMGIDWLRATEGSSAKALDVQLPYRGAGYFNATEVRALALRFEARRGQKLTIRVTLRPAGSFVLFADLFQVADGQLKPVASADSVAAPFNCEIKKTGIYLLRLQPELLKCGEYELTIGAGPSLKFPVAVSGHPRIESFWGDSRDNGGRQHEGIDIFAPEGTPAVAAGKGTVTRVTENKLGGLVVFMRPDNADYNLYYAHLGKQLVQEGQQVLAGDTLGTIDHTGNAKNTPSHLHFGVYISEGAVDPLPFVDRKVAEPAAIRLPLARLNDTLRLATTGEPVWVRGITGDQYEVLDAVGAQRLISGKQTAMLKTLRQEKITAEQVLYDRPDTAAARVKILPAGTRVSVLAGYRGFAFVRWASLTGWLSR